MENYRLNPNDCVIREQEKRLFALDIAARTYNGLGRHDGIDKYAAELLRFVDGAGTERQPMTAITAALPTLTLDELLKMVPPALLRTKKELEKAGVDPDAFKAQRPPTPDDAGAVGGDAAPRDPSHDVGTVQDAAGSRGPASLRQAGGAN